MEYSDLIKLESNFEKMEQVRTGISKSVLEELKDRINIGYDRLSVILGTSSGRLRRKKSDEKFNGPISEKILALSDVYEFGYSVFEDQANLQRWMQIENRALSNKRPIDLLDTSFGMIEVKNLIGRIAHGVYS